MTDFSSKMIIGCFVLLRVLLHKIIMRPWTAIPSLKENNINKKNLLTIGSILYHTIIDYFRENISICPNNQKLLPNKLKVKAQSVRLTATGKTDFSSEILNYLSRRSSWCEIKNVKTFNRCHDRLFNQKTTQSIFCWSKTNVNFIRKKFIKFFLDMKISKRILLIGLKKFINLPIISISIHLKKKEYY